MREMEQFIRDRGREQFYSYYTGLGYDHKTAAVLALFTYGTYNYGRHISINSLYDALYRGEGDLPLDYQERRDALRRLMAAYSNGPSVNSTSGARLAGTAAPKGSAPSGAGPADGARPTGFNFSGASQKAEDTATGLEAFGEGFPDMARPVGSGPAPSAPKRASASRKAPLSSARLLRSISAPILDQDGLAESSSYAGSVLRKPSGSAAFFSTDEYEPIEEKEALSVSSDPTSTFRMTTNTASAGVVLNQLRNGRRIDRSMVRIEEMLNYFRYESALPQEEMFQIYYELMDADGDRKYLYINVQGREEVRDRQNIILLLDVSGSMGTNAEQTQAIIATIVSKLGDGDKVSLVTYSSDDSVELEACTINGPDDRIRFLEKFLAIRIGGYTFGSKGIETAYRIGKSNYIKDGNNQVVLITDGDLNFGITDKGGLEELIEQKKKDNLFLSVIGTGLSNYKDDKLETLCKHGNGVYRTVNNLADVRKCIDEEYASLVNIIAKDVKGQVEFNPELVESHRLLGFENRALAREDFANDKVISEPFGSGGYGVALYELKMRTGDCPVESGLKYSRLVTTGSPEPGTIRVRYKEPLEEISHEQEKIIETADTSFTDNLRLAFIVYVCAEKLRASDKISEDEIRLAKKLYKELGSSIREKNSADLYKLAGILDKSEAELGIGIPEDPFIW